MVNGRESIERRGTQLRSLDRKLLRELYDSRFSSLAIALVIASGVAVFVMALSTLAFLDHSRDSYYERYRFADIFASLTRAPQHLADEIARIPGVAAVGTRVVNEVKLEVPGLAEPAVGRMISLPDHGVVEGLAEAGTVGFPASSGLNGVHLVRGRWPDPSAANEVIASEAFFQANRLNLGSELRGVLQGRFQPLTIVGVGLSPEYVFQIRSGDFLPDDRRFGVLWGTRRQLESAFDMRGAFNDVSVRLARGATTRPVIDRLDQQLGPFGGRGAYDREDQLSARFLNDEIRQLRATALVVPLIFLAVAAFLLNLVLARRIELQREAIATLKAFGYTDGEIGWHFLKFALVIAVSGAAIGSVFGSWLATELCDIYASFFRFPTFEFRPNPSVIGLAIVVSLAAGSGGAWSTVARVVRLPVAEAMRPPVPSRYRRSGADAVWVWLRLPTQLLMILRRLGRRPLATGFAALGIALATAVLLVSRFAIDAVETMIDFQFTIAQRQDLRVIFRQPLAPSAVDELRTLDGVLRVESFRAIPVRLRSAHRDRRVSILGIDDGAQPRDRARLFRLLDADGLPIAIPPGGLVLSDMLAELLDVVPGDTVSVEVLEERRQRFIATVVGIATEYMGTNAYVQRATLHRWLQEERLSSGAFLATDSARVQSIYDRLQEFPLVTAVVSRVASLDAARQTIRESHAKMLGFQTFFAGVIALGVVYNMARVTLSEQRRELATLRVLGFTRTEVSMIFLGEVLVVTLIAIPLGWLVGMGLCFAIAQGFESDLYRIPWVVNFRSLLAVGALTLFSSLASGLIVRRSIDRLDLIAVLKDRG